MCTTHDRISDICYYIRTNPGRYDKFEIYPCMPYAHKYNNAVAELGVMGALKKMLPGSVIGSLARGGISLARKDYIGIMNLLVDAEMKMFNGIQTGVIFLQNIVTDLILGMGMSDFFVAFADYVREKHNAEPGFITMNLPFLLDVLEKRGIDNPIICASINKIGFRMPGGVDLYEKTIASGRCMGHCYANPCGGGCTSKRCHGICLPAKGNNLSSLWCFDKIAYWGDQGID